MAAYCGNCSVAIEVSGGRLPPWCPKCGADTDKTVMAPTSAARVPARPALPAVGILPAADHPAADSPAGSASAAPAEGFDETRPLAVHDFSLKGYLHKFGAGFLLFAIFLVLALGGLVLHFSRPKTGAIVPSLLMAGFGVAFLIYSLAAYGKCIRRVEVFTDGIRWHGPGGTDRLAWEDVEAVYRTELYLNGMLMAELKLVSRQGREVIFDLTIDRYRELAGLVQGRSAEVMRPRKLREAGACGAEFGPVLVGPAGVSVEGWLIPWKSVERYYLASGKLWFEFRGHGRKWIPLCNIPNYLLLLYLMGEFAPPPVRQASGLPAAAE